MIVPYLQLQDIFPFRGKYYMLKAIESESVTLQEIHFLEVSWVYGKIEIFHEVDLQKGLDSLYDSAFLVFKDYVKDIHGLTVYPAARIYQGKREEFGYASPTMQLDADVSLGKNIVLFGDVQINNGKIGDHALFICEDNFWSITLEHIDLENYSCCHILERAPEYIFSIEIGEFGLFQGMVQDDENIAIAKLKRQVV